MKKLVFGLGLALILGGGVVLFVKNSESATSSNSGGEGGPANGEGGAGPQGEPTRLERDQPTLAARFDKLRTSFAEKAGDRRDEASIRQNSEIRAALVLLREVELPEAAMETRQEIYNRLTGRHEDGYPKRSETMYVELIDALKKLKAEDPKVYLNVMAVALLRSSYMEDREVINRSIAPDRYFNETYLKEAGSIMGEDYYQGEDPDLIRKGIVAFGKDLLGLPD